MSNTDTMSVIISGILNYVIPNNINNENILNLFNKSASEVADLMAAMNVCFSDGREYTKRLKKLNGFLTKEFFDKNIKFDSIQTPSDTFADFVRDLHHSLLVDIRLTAEDCKLISPKFDLDHAYVAKYSDSKFSILPNASELGYTFNGIYNSKMSWINGKFYVNTETAYIIRKIISIMSDPMLGRNVVFLPYSFPNLNSIQRNEADLLSYVTAYFQALTCFEKLIYNEPADSAVTEDNIDTNYRAERYTELRRYLCDMFRYLLLDYNDNLSWIK